MSFQARLVTRQAWHARPPTHTEELAVERVRYLVVHYSASDADEQALHSKCAGRVLGIQRYHQQTKGWNDIAYNWLVCRHGSIFRGRGLGIRSAATGPANGFTYAVCFLGDDTKGRADATPEARQAIEDLLEFVRHNCPHLEGVRGHRDFMQTACPGDELYAFAHSLNG